MLAVQCRREMQKPGARLPVAALAQRGEQRLRGLRGVQDDEADLSGRAGARLAPLYAHQRAAVTLVLEVQRRLAADHDRIAAQAAAARLATARFHRRPRAAVAFVREVVPAPLHQLAVAAQRALCAQEALERGLWWVQLPLRNNLACRGDLFCKKTYTLGSLLTRAHMCHSASALPHAGPPIGWLVLLGLK